MRRVVVTDGMCQLSTVDVARQRGLHVVDGQPFVRKMFAPHRDGAAAELSVRESPCWAVAWGSNAVVWRSHSVCCLQHRHSIAC